MFRPYHPGSIEFWLSLSFMLSLYNFLAVNDYITEVSVLDPKAIGLSLCLISLGLIVSVYVGARYGKEKEKASPSTPPQEKDPE